MPNHDKTLENIFAKPDKKNIKWTAFISLLEFHGAVIETRGGSAHNVVLNGERAVFHKPHPGNEIYQSDLKRIRRFLENAGIV